MIDFLRKEKPTEPAEKPVEFVVPNPEQRISPEAVSPKDKQESPSAEVPLAEPFMVAKTETPVAPEYTKEVKQEPKEIINLWLQDLDRVKADPADVMDIIGANSEEKPEV